MPHKKFLPDEYSSSVRFFIEFIRKRDPFSPNPQSVHICIFHHIKNTLSTFYQALYIESDFDAMTQCLAEESRSGFEAVMSMAGITPGFYRNYAQDAVAEVGQDFTIDVRLKELSEYGTADVATLQKTFPNTEKAVLARYEIVFISQKGLESVYTNEMILVMVGNRWYMTTYLTLPIGANMSISNE